jgi:hypothetical protein
MVRSLIACLAVAGLAGCGDTAPESTPRATGGKALPSGVDKIDAAGPKAGSAPASRDDAKGTR